ncbi:hypothetical protein ARAM_007533 [Aspergillus rambellii]|uniref:Uncharacterized protein n=1 Tax=Aspergillus rambellii TaxID=308745 RepID=A0A0F8XTW4_9EURO|nr:hypothetical protein ARAM_007533 [Aspergillus rambellii]
MKPSYLLLNTLLPLVISAIPLHSTSHLTTEIGPGSTSTSITPSQIEAIAPKAKACENPPAPDECATAAQAAPYIARSFATYNVTARAEQAAVLGLMAFESVEFRYNRNHSPGVPGQGTRNMQSPGFNAEYAASIPGLKEALDGGAQGDVVKVLDLLRGNAEYDFGSGAWFLTTQCSAEVRAALRTGSEEGWAGFLTRCVGTDANEERKGYWVRAVQVLG